MNITNDEVLSKYTKDGYTLINIEEFLLNDKIFGDIFIQNMRILLKKGCWN